eukprot:176844-Prorocentrum_lima.AAC.1
MTSSLVGSEMCIRDRIFYNPSWSTGTAKPGPSIPPSTEAHAVAAPRPVSYTHLTLPTICSV